MNLFERQHNKLFDNYFFVIDSATSLESIPSNFYGYAIDGTQIYFSNDEARSFGPATDGCFINILNNGREIIIQQDYYGGFGLYVFNENGYWAVSNNIYYLIRVISKKMKLEVNEDYIAAMLTIASGPYVFDETIIRQLKRVPFATELIINIREKRLSLHEYKMREYYIPIDSPEAFGIIDSWHHRWSSIVSALAEDYPIKVDLSGGKDSRAALAIFFSPRVNQRNIDFFNMDKGEFAKDGPIAAEIANKLGFRLNANQAKFSSYPIPWQVAIERALLAYGLYDPYWNLEPIQYERIFHVGGHAAEVVRRYSRFTARRSIDLLIGMRPEIYSEYIEKCRCLMDRTMTTLNKKYANPELIEAQLMLNKTRLRNHFYAPMLLGYMRNEYVLAPVADYSLSKIRKLDSVNDDLDLLFAIIILRFMPAIRDVPFDKGRYIYNSTWNYAKELNDRFKLTPSDKPLKVEMFGNCCSTVVSPGTEPESSSLPWQHLLSEFENGDFGTLIRGQLGQGVWAYGKELHETGSYWRNLNLCNLYAIANVLCLLDSAGRQ